MTPDHQAAPLSAPDEALRWLATMASVYPHWAASALQAYQAITDLQERVLVLSVMNEVRETQIEEAEARTEAAESALTAPDVSAAKVEGGWKPISDPPENTSEGCSITLWVWSKEYGGNVGFYTPFYLGHEREKEQLWRYAHLPWGFKPTHWRLLPTPPHHSPTVSSAPEVETRGSVPTTATEK